MEDASSDEMEDQNELDDVKKYFDIIEANMTLILIYSL